VSLKAAEPSSAPQAASGDGLSGDGPLESARGFSSRIERCVCVCVQVLNPLWACACRVRTSMVIDIDSGLAMADWLPHATHVSVCCVCSVRLTRQLSFGSTSKSTLPTDRGRLIVMTWTHVQPGEVRLLGLGDLAHTLSSTQVVMLLCPVTHRTPPLAWRPLCAVALYGKS